MKSYETLEKAKEYLVLQGFHEYEPPDFARKNADAFFQKRYIDSIGKRYFIDALIYDFSRAYIPENFVISFEGQYYKAATHDAVNMEFINWDLEDVETWLDKLFALNVLEHYEEWD